MIDNLRKNVWISNWCYTCKWNGESVNHLLLHCSIATDLWSMVLGLFGVHWVMARSAIELLACWQGRFGHHRKGDIWMAVSYCLMWCLWRERNNRSFEDTERIIPDLKLYFLRTLLDWLSAGQSHTLFFVVNLIDLCNLCNWLFDPCILGWPFFISIIILFLIKIKNKKFSTWDRSYFKKSIICFCNSNKMNLPNLYGAKTSIQPFIMQKNSIIKKK